MKLFILREDKLAFLILSVLFILIAVCRINFPELNHGDEFADANVLNAGENFIRLGFINCKFLPVFAPNLNSPSGAAYTHYPALSENINGFLRVIFRTDSLYFFRVVSLFCSFLNLLFWYFFIKLFTNNPLIALVSAVLYVSNPLFIFGVDSLHEACYSELLRSLIFFILIVLTISQKRKKVIFFFLWILVFLGSLITFEYIIYLCLFFTLFKIFFNDQLNNKLRWRDVLVLFFAPVAGFLLHFLQNVWYFGSYLLAFQDLSQSGFRRVFYDPGFTINFYIWWKEVVLRNISLTFLSEGIELILLVSFSCLLYLRLQDESHAKAKTVITSLLKLLLIFIVCGLSWYLFFPLHSYDHRNIIFLARHLLPAAVIAFTIFLYILFIFVPEVQAKSLWQRVLLIMIPVIVCISFVIRGVNRSQLPVTPQKISLEHAFSMFKENFLYLKEISNKNDIIGTTIWRKPYVSYYTNRECQFFRNKEELIRLPQLPRYFILIVNKNEPDIQIDQLSVYLNSRYNLIRHWSYLFWQGWNVLFFELKK